MKFHLTIYNDIRYTDSSRESAYLLPTWLLQHLLKNETEIKHTDIFQCTHFLIKFFLVERILPIYENVLHTYCDSDLHLASLSTSYNIEGRSEIREHKFKEIIKNKVENKKGQKIS